MENYIQKGIYGGESIIQGIIFSKKKYKNPTMCREWLKIHNYKPIKKVDETVQYFRYRLKKPKKNYRYRIVNFGKYIKAIIGFKKY